MDPNRFVERMLQHMYDATRAAQAGDNAVAAEEWQEVKDNLDDLYEWLEKGGFSPNLIFNFQLFK